MPDIKIKLSVDAAEAAEQVKQVAQQSAEALQQAYTRAVDNSKKRIFELVEAEKVHQAAIQLNIQKITELETKIQQASNTEKSAIMQQMTALQRLTEARQNDLSKIAEKKAKLEANASAAVATTEAEKLAIQLVNQNRLIEINTLRDQVKAQQAVKDATVSTCEAAQSKIGELNRKQQEAIAVIDAHKSKIIELQKQRENSLLQDHKEIDSQIDGYKKVVSAHEEEISEIQKKKIKQEEVIALALAGSDKERAAIMDANSKRRAGIQIMQEQKEVTEQATGASDEQNTTLSKFFGMFSASAGVLAFWREMKQLLIENRQIIDDIISAKEKLSDMAGDQYTAFKPYFSANNLTNVASQNAAERNLLQIAKDNNVEPSVVAATGVEMAAPLNNHNIPIGTDRYNQLVGVASRFTDKGLNKTTTADYINDLLNDPNTANITGDQLNQNLSDIIAVTGGDPGRANDMLAVFQEDKGRYREAGFGLSDVEKSFAGLQATGFSAHNIGPVIRQTFQSLVRTGGLNSKEIAELHGKLQRFDEVGSDTLKMEQEDNFSPEQMVKSQERLRKSGVPELDAFFEDAVKSGHIDPLKLYQIISTLPNEKKNIAAGILNPDEKNIAARSVGGPRGLSALGAAFDVGGVTLPSGSPMMPVSNNPEQSTRVGKALADANNALGSPSDPFLQEFLEETRNEVQNVESDLNHTKGWLERHPTIGTLVTGQHMADSDEISFGRTLTNRLVGYSRIMDDIRSGRRSATPDQKAKLQDAMTRTLGQLEQRGRQSESIKALADPSGAWVWHDDNDVKQTITAGQAIKDYDANPKAFLDDKLYESSITNVSGEFFEGKNVKDTGTIAPILDEGDQVSKDILAKPPSPNAQPTPTGQTPGAKPATQPSGPSAINYITNNHVRQIVYGQSYDQIGAPNMYDNTMG